MALVTRIVRLLLQQAPLETLTAEALPALLDLLAAEAGALLLYHPEDGTLTLAGARGLSAAGARLLETLRRGDESSWPVPLHALLDRKVLLIERPDADPSVPELVGHDGGKALANLAAIPLYRWHLPVGVVLAIAGRRSIDEREILSQVLAYDVLAMALAAALAARASGAEADASLAGDPPPPLVCEHWVDPRQAARNEAERLLAERQPSTERQRTDDRDAIAETLGELRAAFQALEAECRAAVADHAAFAYRIAAAEDARTEMLARVAALEAQVARAVETRVEAPPASAPAAPPAPDSAAAPQAAAPSLEPHPEPPSAPAALAPPAPSTSELHPCRVLEPNSELAAQISAAIEKTLPGTRSHGLVVANLLAATPTLREEMAAGAATGMPVLAYAAADDGRSRILGAVRCFAGPPTAAEAVALVKSLPSGGKRVITVSDDADALLPLKVALTKSGHSVSMACDEKQALDLLALFRPDVVVVDLRVAPESAADFLDALGLEGGRILTVLVCGDPSGDTLTRAATSLARPASIDAVELVRSGRVWLNYGPPPSPAR